LEIPSQPSEVRTGGQNSIPLQINGSHFHRKLLCITSSAGIGKTMAVEQTIHLHSRLPDHWVIHYQFDKLPIDPDGFWGLVPMDGSSDSICERIAEHLDQTSNPGDSPVWKAAANLLVKSKMDAGQVTIIVDGLDEHDPATGVSRARALRKFLTQNPRLHCVVAGRPYAIAESYWDALFATSEDRRDDKSLWLFGCVGMFTQDQIRRSLGPKRAERILSLVGELNLTRRTIEVLRSLPDESFARINNLCDVYWESLPRTFEEDVLKKKKGGVTPNVGGIQIDTFIEYACALAITMFLDTKREVQYRDIADDLLTRLKTIPKWQGDSAESLDKRRESIEALNAGAIEFRLFNRIDTLVSWRDNTLRDFFAALWMVRYSNDAELKHLIETIPARPREPDDNEVWEFIASMPVGAMVAGPKSERCMRWLRLAEANRKDADHQKLNHWRVDPKDYEAREKVAWFDENSLGHTWPVDAKKDGSHTNPFGLVDMLGNVWEWTENLYEVGQVSRVVRGGSFGNPGLGALASYRNRGGPTDAGISGGFRVARAP
jgi:hypothetical protein